VRVPAALGLNETLMVQAGALANRLVPQLLVCKKSAALVPEMATLDIVSAVLPVFVTATV
jgi:hypothetical protein